ncbi:hypothetical protein COCCADRAFT_113685 [Bipolaris zeicola 26-R-13]|uniref:Uncharacterized protein n=1 Tax=Cochliobolus carbonum (strain 26-R-13) TaxID=930089 RepID=W6Y5Y0_COCC2|nr:uncharacterized protein COCCADRAFT_113685 [Bipolaris zeicola 26-R-13]EUC26666.1 hypothetical protein COCCADRAFT_113685 [Bipolaris zeicola 26-R-13]
MRIKIDFKLPSLPVLRCNVYCVWSVRATVQPMQHHLPHQNIHPSFSTRDNSTTMTALVKAIAAINS